MAATRAVDGIDVWTSALDDVQPSSLRAYASWLAPEERLANERFATERLRGEHLLARALCRWVLSRYAAGVAPLEWRFDRTEAGRPFVEGPLGPAELAELPSFNLSHADGFVVCAVSRYPVGVDVEPIARGDELLATAKNVFSERELADLSRLDRGSQARRAVELWTVKEAWLKARGHGISVRLGRFTVVPHATRPGRYELEDASALGDDPRRWQLDVTDVRSHAVAVAVGRGLEPDLSIDVRPVIPG